MDLENGLYNEKIRVDRTENASVSTPDASRVSAVDITRSLRDRGKDRLEDRALISFQSVNPRSARAGLIRWVYVFKGNLSTELTDKSYQERT